MAITSTPTPAVVIGTRGSALALAQANRVLRDCVAAFPKRRFELRIIKTTGDKLQTASLSQPDVSLPRGLFTKELETALVEREIDIAVHSLKDLPTELPEGLILGAVGARADVRDVLIYRTAAWVGFRPKPSLEWVPGKGNQKIPAVVQALARLPEGATVATSSARRAAQMRAWRPDLKIVEIRGNVGTRLRKLRESDSVDATILALAGLHRLHLDVSPQGVLRVDPRLPAVERAKVEAPPEGLFATVMEPNEMLPAVGQGAVALETRADDAEVAEICRALNHPNTWHSVLAERAFLRGLGGGCQSAVAAWARVVGHQVHLRAGVFSGSTPWVRDFQRVVRESVELGMSAAQEVPNHVRAAPKAG